MKLWLFGTYAWQGNPKALFLYMNKHCADTHECWWIADNEKDADTIKKATGFEKVTHLNSKTGADLFARCDVYVTENFRETYPENLPETAKIFNTWHGVGLKHIELALGMDSVLAESIVKKYIKNYTRYKNQVLFLATSQAMQDHFLKDTAISAEYIVQGDYPRNIVYKSADLRTFDIDDVLPQPKAAYNKIAVFAPTYRIGALDGILHSLVPDFERLNEAMRQSNQLMIVKVHPFMKKDAYFGEMAEKYADSKHLLFWDDRYDIYEIFSDIDVAVVDYSSIFYDLLDAGVNRFIRYIPDFEQYRQDLELIGDYMDLTDGTVAQNYSELLDLLASDLSEISGERKAYLNDYFFGFAQKDRMQTDTGNEPDETASLPVCRSSAVDALIKQVEECRLKTSELKELHSFDVFDTLIRRSTLKPFGVFDYIRDQAKASDIAFPTFLLENWVTIRNKVEHDVRDMMRKTTFERQSDTLEVTLNQIYARLQDNMGLTDEQTEFLKQTEIEGEIAHVEPIQKRIDFLFSLKEAGHDVILASDMYLPEEVIRAMLAEADPRLAEIPLYLSSSIGYQKSTAKLYQHIFFDIGYCYSRWVHYGDNKHADGSVPRRLGIETMVHDIDDFIPFESGLVNAMDNFNRYPAYRLATKMHRYRSALLSEMDNRLLEQKYYAYAYVGSAFVPYINWVVQDALRRGYKTLYFISRDGHFLKQIADKIIEIQGHNIQTKYIYGSRKVWRLPSFIDKVDDETFWQFGNFVGMDSFDDLVKASYLDEDELLTMFPEFESLKDAKHLRGHIAENIRKILGSSEAYRNRVLEIAAEKRIVVRKYLQQEINADEKFAFVEFWGRGYTQDTFSRLLNDAFGREVANPFYYVRSFTDNIGTSLRHNFILTPQNFSFFEPIFAQTPYQSIAAYSDGVRVEPVIVPTDSTMSDIISQGLQDFTADYLSLDTADAEYFNRALAQYSYNYQLGTPNDQFICNAFAELKDNISSFGDVKAYAPALTLSDLQNSGSKQELDKLTLSFPISLAKSDPKTVEYYQKIQKSYKLPAVNVQPMKPVFPANDLDMYVYSGQVPFDVIALQNNSFYMDVAFNDSTKRKDIYLQKFHTVEVIGIDWLKNGVPRLLTPYGYITANKEWVQKFSDVSEHFIKKTDGNGYEWQPDRRLNALINVAIKQLGIKGSTASAKPAPNNGKAAAKSITSKPAAIGSAQRKKLADNSVFQRKLYKFSRDPYNFFKDSKNKKTARLKFFFDEKHWWGRKLSKFVRNHFNG